MSIRCENRGKSRLISKLSACFLPLFSRWPELLRVDSSHQEETELGRLMHDFRCKEAKEMHSRILANRVHQLKETQKGVEIMCKEMDAIYRQGEKRGENAGRIKEKLSIITKMIKEGMPVSVIKTCTEATDQEIEQARSSIEV